MTDAKTKLSWFLIALLILFHTVNNYLWIKKDCESIECDVVSHTYLTRTMYYDLRGAYCSPAGFVEKCKLVFSCIDTKEPYWPPLVHFITAHLAFFSDDFLHCVRFSNMLYFALFIVSIFLIGKKLCGLLAGLLSAFIVSFYPAIFGISRYYGIDFPAMAFVALIICFLVYDPFRRTPYSIAMGIVLGAAGLVNGRCVFFIVGPLLYVIMIGLISREKKLRYFINVAIALTIGFIIALTWWSRIFTKNGVVATRELYLQSQNAQYMGYSVFMALQHYLRIVSTNLTLPFFILFLSGLVCYVRKLCQRDFIIVFLWLFVPFFGFSFLLPHLTKLFFARYLFPGFGAVSIISVCGLMSFPFKRITRCVMIFFVIACLGLGIYQFFRISYGPCDIHIPYCNRPSYNNHKQIIGTFNELIKESLPEERLIGIIEHARFNGDFTWRLRCYFKVLNKNNEAEVSSHSSIPGLKELRGQFFNQLDHYRYLVAFSDFPEGPDFSTIKQYAKVTEYEWAEQALKTFKNFEIIKTDILEPDRLHIFLLKRKGG